MFSGARRLPTQHLSIRVPWHDSGWIGKVCDCPSLNTACRVLPRVAETKDDDHEDGIGGQSLEGLEERQWPPCVTERAAFMATFPMTSRKNHPYANQNPEKYGHFRDTPFTVRPYSAACVPFRWMLAQNAPEYTERFQLDFRTEREPELGFKTAWVQERKNQLALLDTFFSGVKANESLCFFYAKDTPLSSSSRRVIVGVGRCLDVASHVEYRYEPEHHDGIRCVLWERDVAHSIRPGFKDGFLFPYAEIMGIAEEQGLDPESFLAFAPDEAFDSFSYASEHVSHDHAIASLRSCVDALEKIAKLHEGPWKAVRTWLDSELNRLWKLRGPYPGFGSALAAFLGPGGSLVAFDLARQASEEQDNEAGVDPWPAFEALMADPSSATGVVAEVVGAGFARTWTGMPDERKALLKLLSRFALSEDQARRFYEPTARPGKATDANIIANPYLLYELDRGEPDAITVETIDRGLMPSAAISSAFPVPEPSRLEDAVDPRRVRALTVATLEVAAEEGHTLLPLGWLIDRIESVAPKDTPCPIGFDVLNGLAPSFAPIVVQKPVADGAGYQLDRLVEAGGLIRETVNKRVGEKARRHALSYDWRAKVDTALPELPSGDELEVEEAARSEKAKALEEIACSRFSVLIGPAGTGKTTLLQVLCKLPEVEEGGVLLLAPTGKARVQLENKTQMGGQGKTIAQFLLRFGGRYNGETGQYLVTGSPDKCSEYKTVIVDECSMLTEEQLAAVLDALSGVQRLVLVGDHRQLPPIGSGRPFVDIVQRLAPDDIEVRPIKVDRGYAELTIPRRQQGRTRADLLLAGWFGGIADPAADEIWDRVSTETLDELRFVKWETPDDLPDLLLDVLIEELDLEGRDDETGFTESLGGSSYGGRGYMWQNREPIEDEASTAESWQIITPVRGREAGVDNINRLVQRTFRKGWIDEATEQKEWYYKRVNPPWGRAGLIYGDKVINLQNSSRRKVWPDREPYVANGDVGVIVGSIKTKRRKLFRQLEVEFTSQPQYAYKYWGSEFGEEGTDPLDLAYALTVHKTQGSEFGVTFVVLPNPCWLLSRELLYTALTRQQDRVVILHQGDIHDLRQYSQMARSDIARRITNLFRAPSPIEIEHDGNKSFLEEGLIHRTNRGDLVRSKSEVIVANELFVQGVESYEYERPLKMASGRTRYPDFTIEDDDTGAVFYWEHLGLLHNPEYQARWNKKLEEYRATGIRPVDEGGELIITRDDAHGGIDSGEIARLVAEYLS